MTKTNKTFKPERLTRECICSNPSLNSICPVCNMWEYRKFYKTIIGISKTSYVFVNSNGSLITSRVWRDEFKKALALVNIVAKHPYWRPHSLRKGEISDLVAAGIAFEMIKKHARHTPDSKTTFLYIQLETDEEASIVHDKYLKYF